MAEFIQNQKKHDSLIYQGYIFNCDREKKDGRKFWKCKYYYGGAARCGKRVHTRGDEIIEEFSVHNHAPSAAESL